MADTGVDDMRRTSVMAVARAHGNDRYLAALLAPAGVRDDLMALAAFSGEVARIPQVVSDPTIGEIRLQWWRDALPVLQQGETIGHPVADALGNAIRRHGLPTGLLLGVLDARAFDLYPDPMPDEQTFRAYLARSEGALVELALRVLDARAAGAAAGAAIAAGQAIGLVRVLAGLPHMLSRSRCVIPAPRLDAAHLEVADLAAVPPSAAARALVRDLVAQARQAVGRVRQDWSRIDRKARPALLPVALVEPHLRVFERSGHHAGRDVASVMPLARVWRIWSAHALGRL